MPEFPVIEEPIIRVSKGTKVGWYREVIPSSLYNHICWTKGFLYRNRDKLHITLLHYIF